MAILTLDQLIPGESGRITEVKGKGAIRRRLVDMGLTSGAVIDMVKTSPLGDPVEYRLRGYHLSLRKSEAKTIQVELIGDPIPLRDWEHHSRSGQPLGLCLSGQEVEITRTRGGKRMNSRLNELGLNPGLKIRIIQNEFPGPLIISVNDENRLVIGKGMAMHIQVRPS